MIDYTSILARISLKRPSGKKVLLHSSLNFDSYLSGNSLEIPLHFTLTPVVWYVTRPEELNLRQRTLRPSPVDDESETEEFIESERKKVKETIRRYMSITFWMLLALLGLALMVSVAIPPK